MDAKAQNSHRQEMAQRQGHPCYKLQPFTFPCCPFSGSLAYRTPRQFSAASVLLIWCSVCALCAGGSAASLVLRFALHRQPDRGRQSIMHEQKGTGACQPSRNGRKDGYSTLLEVKTVCLTPGLSCYHSFYIRCIKQISVQICGADRSWALKHVFLLS